MFDVAQIKLLVKLISVTAAATVKEQQAATVPTAVSPTATGMTTATTPSLNDGPRLKGKLREFSGEKADWDEWHKVHSSQARILGVAEELMATDEIRVGAENFNSQDIDPLRAKRTFEAWVSPPAKARRWRCRELTRLELRGGSCCDGIVPAV